MEVNSVLLTELCTTICKGAICKNWPPVELTLPANRGSISPGKLTATSHILFITVAMANAVSCAASQSVGVYTASKGAPDHSEEEVFRPWAS